MALDPSPKTRQPIVPIALTLALVATPARAFEELARLESGAALPRPLLHAAAIAILPVVSVGLAAALLPNRTVGSVVIATLGAVLAYLGGVVSGDLVASRLPVLAAHAQGHRLAAAIALPMQAVGVVAAFLPALWALPAVLVGAVWSQGVGLVGARDLLALPAPARLAAVTACALAVNGPVLLRSALYAL